MDSTLMLGHITACQGRNEDAFNFSLHLSKAQVDREQQYRDGHWHARHLEDATNAKRKFKDVLGHKVFCHWIPFQHPIDPMVDDSTYPTSKTDLGFMIVMNKCKPWLWSRPFALLDLAWNLHTLFKEPPAISSWKVTSSKLTVSAPQKTQICVYFSRCFQVFPNSEDVHLCFIYPSKQTQVYCQRKGAEHANARGLSIVCWEKSQLKLTTVKVMFW